MSREPLKIDWDIPVDYQAVDGRRRIGISQKDGTINAFTITASPSGIHFGGSLFGEIKNAEDLDRFAQAVTDAWKWHVTLSPRLVLNSSGH